MTQDRFNLIMEVITAAIFGGVGAFAVWALVPDAQWWLTGGTGVFWFLVTFFSFSDGSRR